MLLRTSPVDAWHDFTSSPYRVEKDILVGLGTLGLVFGVIYLLAVAMAAVLIISITRATARLSRGARAVAAGDLSYRIPVRRRDQLGDLALSFNAMTEAVGRMLHEVADKERMKREMELAREVQQSLLPETAVVHGGIQMHAHFRPASEVGGDYFDVFRLDGGRLLVSIGDVAGHGLSTGLVMAMVKAAIATLVREGHRGAALLERLNGNLVEQTTRQRMATLALVEVDGQRQLIEVTSSGHPPALLLGPDGTVVEVELSSLPLGCRLPVEPATRTLPFPSGSVALLYTDGLVEATDATGNPFGYDGLRHAVAGRPGASAEQVVHTVLVALDRHLAGCPAGDDLTVLAIELSATSSSV
jgi:phosphoserine phosphatase RsbU/P